LHPCPNDSQGWEFEPSVVAGSAVSEPIIDNRRSFADFESQSLEAQSVQRKSEVLLFQQTVSQLVPRIGRVRPVEDF
jgi:hypothetical protein